MAKIQGTDVISQATDKSSRRLYVLGAVIFLIKFYKVDLDDLSIIGVKLPAELFDLVSLVLLIWGIYQLLINWLVDIVSFQKWYQSRNLWSEIQTNMTIDKNFYNGGKRLLMELHDLKRKGQFPSNDKEISKQVQDDYEDFKANVELYISRLEAAGNNFQSVTNWGKYYVWGHAFIIPLLISIVALITLMLNGNFY